MKTSKPTLAVIIAALGLGFGVAVSHAEPGATTPVNAPCAMGGGMQQGMMGGGMGYGMMQGGMRQGMMGGGMGPRMMQGGMRQGMMGGGMGYGMMQGGSQRGMAGPNSAIQQLMTPEERNAMIEKMRNAKTPDERQKLAIENRAEMEKRAKEKGITLPPARGPHFGPGQNPG